MANVPKPWRNKPPSKPEEGATPSANYTFAVHGHEVRVYFVRENDLAKLVKFGQSVKARMDESARDKLLKWGANLYPLAGYRILLPDYWVNREWQVIDLGHLNVVQRAIRPGDLHRVNVLVSF